MVTENSTEQSPQLRADENEEKILEAIGDKIPKYSPPEIENKVFVAASIGQIINVDEKRGIWTAMLEIVSYYRTKHKLWPAKWSVDAQTSTPCLLVPQDYVWAPSLSKYQTPPPPPPPPSPPSTAPPSTTPLIKSLLLLKKFATPADGNEVLQYDPVGLCGVLKFFAIFKCPTAIFFSLVNKLS